MSNTLADLAEPFFAAAREGRLVIPKCLHCQRNFFYPTVVCPHCHKIGHEWVESTGRGSVYSFSVVYRAPAQNVKTPYVVAVIDLDDGVRMMTNIVGVDPSSITVGMRVEVGFGPSFEGQVVPQFVLEGSTA